MRFIFGTRIAVKESSLKLRMKDWRTE